MRFLCQEYLNHILIFLFYKQNQYFEKFPNYILTKMPSDKIKYIVNLMLILQYVNVQGVKLLNISLF